MPLIKLRKYGRIHEDLACAGVVNVCADVGQTLDDVNFSSEFVCQKYY